MQRLVVRAIEEFLRDTHGDALWTRVVADCDARTREGVTGSAPVPRDREQQIHQLLSVTAERLRRPVGELFEDMGAWLARREAIRRLLRFSGRDFRDFLMRLEELPGRAHFVIPDLDMPQIEITLQSNQSLRLSFPHSAPGWSEILAGVLRVMADDYGTLALIEVKGDEVHVQISDDAFAEGREFRLVGDRAADMATRR